MQNMKPQLFGYWERQTDLPCSRVYPKLIEFREEGMYLGTGTESGEAPGWDSGTWQLISSTQIRISTLNDAIITYQFSLQDDRLRFVDPDGCEFEYSRMK